MFAIMNYFRSGGTGRLIRTGKFLKQNIKTMEGERKLFKRKFR